LRFRLWHLFLVLGIIFSTLALMILFVSTAAFVEEHREGNAEISGTLYLSCCMPSFLPGAIIFVVLAILFSGRSKGLRRLAARLESYRIVTISELSSRMGKSEEKVLKMVKKCIKWGYVNGRLDRAERTYYSLDFLERSPHIVNGFVCSSCGHENKVMVLPGEMVRCSSCGDPFERSDRVVSAVDGRDLVPPKDRKGWSKPFQ